MLKEILTLRKCRQIWEKRVSKENKYELHRLNPSFSSYQDVDFFDVVFTLHRNLMQLEAHRHKIERLDALSKSEESEIWKVVMMMAEGVVDGEMELIDKLAVQEFTEMCDYYEENSENLIPLVVSNISWSYQTEATKTTIVRHMHALGIPKYEGNLVVL